MRLRKLKKNSELLSECSYLIKEPKDNYFKNENPIHLEIGMGKGDFLLQMALDNPNINFIGVEKYEIIIARAINKINEYEFNNLKLLNIDALELDSYLLNKIDTIYLNFSDPWPKSKHHKRRLTSDCYLTLFDKLFIKEKRIVLKTDNDNFFADSIISLNRNNYKIVNLSLDLHQTNILNVETEYEKKYTAQGVKIKYLEAIK